MSPPYHWKQRLYDAYVSSHQVTDTGGSAVAQLNNRSAYINRLISEHIPPDRSARIVDLGCGHGAFLFFLNRVGYKHISGVDISPEQVTFAQRLGIPGVHQGEIASYLAGISGSSVDVVLLMDVIEHMERGEMLHILDEVNRVLAPGGKCLAHVPNAAGLYGMRIRYGDLTHEQAFTSDSARQAFYTSAFTKVTCYEEKPIVHGFKSFVRRLIWDLGTLAPRLLLMAETGQGGEILSQNILIVAYK